jgi:hypothetical protein
MTDEEKARLDIAWKYFDLHAKQRTTMFQFFTAMVPVVVGGYFYLAKDHAYFGTLMVVACIGLALSLGFWLIDKRNEQLVNISRKHICELETAILYRDGGVPRRLQYCGPGQSTVVRTSALSLHHVSAVHSGYRRVSRTGLQRVEHRISAHRTPKCVG